ncbi:MAG TPA: response regulator [Kofleriaceae bacterium]|nr:response regulator [Kofleriaceae bacterium]
MPRVLLVDDSALIRSSMQAALEPMGIELAHAENGEIAVAKAASSRWDLIFLDVVMPVMDGPTALAEIRARGIKTPVVLVTSVSSAAVVAGAVKLGNVQYISKPFTPDMIKSVTLKLLKLDVSKLHPPPRVLVHHIDPELPKQVQRMLPAHIGIDAVTTLADAIAGVEERGHELVLFEPPDLDDDAVSIASVFRELLPTSGIFAIAPTNHVISERPWNPKGPLDGILARPFEPQLGRGFLYTNFLRPLVFLEQGCARAAGFQGNPAHAPAYLAMLERQLRDRCARADLTLELRIDLQDMQTDAATVLALAERVNDDLRDAGAAPAFMLGALGEQISAEQRARFLLM